MSSISGWRRLRIQISAEKSKTSDRGTAHPSAYHRHGGYQTATAIAASTTGINFHTVAIIVQFRVDEVPLRGHSGTLAQPRVLAPGIADVAGYQGWWSVGPGTSGRISSVQ